MTTASFTSETVLNPSAKAGTFASLKKHQVEAVGLLSIGTLLEYFDLMLYVHMAILLNEVFFPKTTPHTTALLSAFAFCSSYVLRPFGALLFGYIGDKAGRKVTVIVTTFLMAFACCVMAVVPTYAQIGILASWIVTLCRAAQGLASMGEITGAQLYLTEFLSPPIRYPCVIAMSITSVLGTCIALCAASIVTLHGVNWRYAFWFGAIIALVGSVARTGLRETPDFINAKTRIKSSLEECVVDTKLLNDSPIYQQKVRIKTILALFLLQCTWPTCSYFSYIYCSNALKINFGLTAVQIIHQNLLISISHVIFLIISAYCSYKIYPIKIVKALLIPFFALTILSPVFLTNTANPDLLFWIRMLIVLLAPASFFIMPIAFIHIPVVKRFTCVSLSFAISHSLFYFITSFGMVYLVDWFGYWGITVAMLPLTVGFTWATLHFERLDKELPTTLGKKNV